MASWQVHLLTAFLRHYVKRKFMAQTDLNQVRAALEGVKHRVPKGVVAKDCSFGGIAGEWLNAAGGVPGATLFYLHGGGYFACSAQTHRPITAGFARRGLEVFAPNYRLAPEHPFPAAVDDAVAAYLGLLASGIPTCRITIAGDSAGGGLALATLMRLRDAGHPLPAAALLFSPWTDLAGTGASLVSNNKRDAMFDGAKIALAAAPYLAGTDPRHPLASPLYGALHGLPPLLIHVSSDEVLLDDSTRLADRSRAAGVTVTLRRWPAVPHVWQMFNLLPETRQSMDEAAGFLLAASQEAAPIAA